MPGQRPYWSGQIRISLVSLGVDIFPATRRGSQVPLHEIDKNTGERIRHRNVNDDGKFVEDEDIVRGFEVQKDDYVILDRDEIEAIKLPSSDTLNLDDFVEADEISPMHIERPYYVLPSGKDDHEVYSTLAEALRESGKAGIGQITLRGREELCAVMALDRGIILETLRYNSELQSPADFFAGLKEGNLKSDYVSLAKQLIEKNARVPHFERYHDHYHEALLELIAAKKMHRKPRLPKTEVRHAKVVNFMDALQRSLKESASAKNRAPAHRRRKVG